MRISRSLEVNGFLHKPGDAADMAATVQRLIDDKALHNQLPQPTPFRHN